MPNLKKLGELEISQDMDFQRRMWTASLLELVTKLLTCLNQLLANKRQF